MRLGSQSWHTTRKHWKTITLLWNRLNIPNTAKEREKPLFFKLARKPLTLTIGATALWATSSVLLTESSQSENESLVTKEKLNLTEGNNKKMIQLSNQTNETVVNTIRQGLPDVILYQYTPCPYCNKVRAVCDYYKIPFRCIEVNPLTKKELAFSSYKKVPVAIIDGKQINGSTDIVLNIQQKMEQLENNHKVCPVTEEQKKWLDWVDDCFIHLLPPNIYRTPKEAVESFDYILQHGKFGRWQQETTRWFGGMTMFLVAKRLKSKYHIQDERESLYEAINLWCTQAVGEKAFLGGQEPCLADLVMFGVLRSLQYYTVFQDIQQHTRMHSWYQRMEHEVGTCCIVSVEE
eukprot:jgi/Galph1/1738/GphlegSOOS_G416.1